MNIRLSILMLIFAGLSPLLHAQTPESKFMAGLAATAMDFQGPINNDYFQFNSYDYGINISAHAYLHRFLNASLGTSMVPRASYPTSDLTTEELLLLDVSANLHFKFINNGSVARENFPFQPYLFSGLGINLAENNVNPYAPTGLGMKFRISSNVNFMLEAAYKFRLGGDAYQPVTYNAGFVFKIPSKKDEDIVPEDPPIDPPEEEEEEEEALEGNGRKDSDFDGIPDDEDDCPNEAGLITLNGCPSKLVGDNEEGGNGDNDNGNDNNDGNDGDNGNGDDTQLIDLTGTEAFPDSSDFPQMYSYNDPSEYPTKIEEDDLDFLSFAMHAIHFETGSATILPESYAVLDTVAFLMQKYPNFGLSVEGHTDHVGSKRDNLVLSINRAFNVKKYLAYRCRVRLARIESNGFGEDEPMATNETTEGRRLNRRVEFRLLK